MAPPVTPTGSHTSQVTTPIRPETIEKRLRLEGFFFPRNKSIFDQRDQQTPRILRALGVVSKNGNLGGHHTVAKKLHVIFKAAVDITVRYPSFDLQRLNFWEALVTEIERQDPQITVSLGPDDVIIRSLTTIVSAYAEGYVQANDMDEDQQHSSWSSSTRSPAASPDANLLSSTRAWCKAFQAHPSYIAKTSPTQINAVTGGSKQVSPTQQRAGESHEQYVARLRSAHREAQAGNKNLEAARRHADRANQLYHHELYDQQDRAQARIKRLEGEIRELRAGGPRGSDEEEEGDGQAHWVREHGWDDRFRVPQHRDQSEDAEEGGGIIRYQ